MTVALLLGTLLSLAALAFVLYPLFVEHSPVAHPQRKAWSDDAGRDDAIGALREIEFDRETGKLSESDYETLKARYTERALANMRARDAAAVQAAASSGVVPDSGGDDLAEAFVRRVREHGLACADCGPRPESDALYCSSCGRYLPGACAKCGAAITEPGARFCGSCGESLAA
jgi:hypothetical protein